MTVWDFILSKQLSKRAPIRIAIPCWIICNVHYKCTVYVLYTCIRTVYASLLWSSVTLCLSWSLEGNSICCAVYRLKSKPFGPSTKQNRQETAASCSHFAVFFWSIIVVVVLAAVAIGDTKRVGDGDNKCVSGLWSCLQKWGRKHGNSELGKSEVEKFSRLELE